MMLSNASLILVRYIYNKYAQEAYFYILDKY